MSPELDSLRKQLERARRYCDFLREQRAGYGLRVPADLELELEEKEAEVAALEAKLDKLIQGVTNGYTPNQPPTLPIELPLAARHFVRRQPGGREGIHICVGFALLYSEGGHGHFLDVPSQR